MTNDARITPLARTLEPNNLRLLFAGGGWISDVVRAVRDDARFLSVVRRGLFPTRLDVTPAAPSSVFPPLRPFSVPSLKGKRIALVASGGSGALASLCGVRRAFEEAGLDVVFISACSGAVLFSSLWSFGWSAEEMARFWLSLDVRDYVDPDWRALGRALLHRMRNFGGFLRGDAIEATFRRAFDAATLGEAKIPLSIIAWNVDHNRVDWLGTKTTPDLELARAVRVAISIPLFVEPVRIGKSLVGDGGVVSIFPARPVADLDPPADLVIGVNCYFPENFEGVDIGDWRPRDFAVFRASAQLRTCVSLELAREQVKLLGRKLVLLHPVPYTEIAGARFYETFLDRTKWPDFMRAGHLATRQALQAMASETREVAAAAHP